MQMPQTVVITSGFFCPLGPQHLKLFKSAKKLGDVHIVGLNSDECSFKKTGKSPFMPFENRKVIIEELRCVDQCMAFPDEDGTACKLIESIYLANKEAVDKGVIKLIFANGGDRQQNSTPEEQFVKDHLNGKVEMVYGVGGYEKSGSSSEFLKKHVLETWKKYNGNMEEYAKNKY